jgi:hypothetical protein
MLTNNANNNDKLRKRSRTNLAIINTITTVRELTWNKEWKVSNNQSATTSEQNPKGHLITFNR